MDEYILVRCFDTSGRCRLVVDLIASIADLDGERFALAVAALEKLSRMGDADFDMLMLHYSYMETED